MPTSDDRTTAPHQLMFLVDTNVISVARKRERADPGVIAFWQEAASNDIPIFLAAVTIGELRRGIELISHRGDRAQAALLEQWLQQVLDTSDITNLRHVRTTAETREAEEIAKEGLDNPGNCPTQGLRLMPRLNDNFSTGGYPDLP